MPKRLYISNELGRSGIDITWTPSAQRLDIGAWYDSCVGIEGDSMTLSQFFEELGISEKDCAKAFRQLK